MSTNQPQTIDQFIKTYPSDVQEILTAIRETIQKAVPEAQEKISYGIPTFIYKDKNLVHFSAYKHHIGFYPTSSGISNFQKELEAYKTSKGTLQFPLDKPIPYDLITKIVLFRVEELKPRMDYKRFNAIFLINSHTPNKILLLERAESKTFAPGFYTGIGGKIGDMPEFANETPLESAYRELQEETEGELSKNDIELIEFARCIVDQDKVLHYFYGIHTDTSTPHIQKSDGTLEWVSREQLFNRKFIPTARMICEEWMKRDFAQSKPFSIYVRKTGTENTVSLVELLQVKEGLL